MNNPVIREIQMVDLNSQYHRYQKEINGAIQKVLEESRFINGPEVHDFANNLKNYLNVNHIVTCGNGTDALQIALMTIGIQPGDEVIVPAFNYIATAEAIAHLGGVPVFVDVDPHLFTTDIKDIEKKITPRSKAIMPVHLFGQCAPMEEIIGLAEKYQLKIIEDNAQSIGSKYTFSNGDVRSAGSMGDIGCLSFFPAKTLGCYGDGGAMIFDDIELAEKAKMIANHGQPVKYTHDLIGVNSRLDTLQAAILDVKLKYLDDFIHRRREVATNYDVRFHDIEEITTPSRAKYSIHSFHQYTIQVKGMDRGKIKMGLANKGIPSMVYYPFPLHKQKAFEEFKSTNESYPVSEKLCNEVLSLPIHTEMEEEQIDRICTTLISIIKTKS